MGIKGLIKRIYKNNDSILTIICRAWNELDVKIIEPYLADNLEYSSFFVRNPIKSKKEYVEYLEGKFNTLKSNGSTIHAEIKEERGVERIFICQNNKTTSVLVVETGNEHIQRMSLRPRFSDETFDERSQLYSDIFNKSGFILDNYFRSLDYKNGERWGWIQTRPPQIRFQDLCITYKRHILCIIIGIYDKEISDEIVLNWQEYTNLLRECETHNMIPCISLFDLRSGNPILNNSNLYDARTFRALDIENMDVDKSQVMSKWELNNIGIMAVIDDLEKNNYKINDICDVVGIYPQIWFYYNGELAYVIVRSIPVGLNKEKYRINKKQLEQYSQYKGFFANVQWISMERDDLDFNDKTLPRGAELSRKEIEFIEIERAIKEFDFIEMEDTGCYIVCDNRKNINN